MRVEAASGTVIYVNFEEHFGLEAIEGIFFVCSAEDLGFLRALATNIQN